MTDEEKELDEVAEDIINGLQDDLDEVLYEHDPIEDYEDWR